MTTITKEEAIRNLGRYVNMDLYLLADAYGITPYKNGKQNKGWKGLLLERLAGLENNSFREPDGGEYELKSVSFIKKKDIFVAKETMAITMLNEHDVLNETFFSSHCWKKLESLVLCAIHWHGKNTSQAELINISEFGFSKNDKLTLEIKEDYDFIREKLRKNGFKSLTGKDGKWIQARTKGAGHGSTSRAFYARKELVNKIFGVEEYS